MKMTFVVLSMLLAAPALAGPFGLEMGMTLRQLEGKLGRIVEKDGSYKAQTVPLPNKAFEFYAIRFSKTSGLCKVSGIGKDIHANQTGTQLRQMYEGLLKALTAKYGEPNEAFDFVHPGALYDEDDEFMWSLYKEERSLVAIWDSKKMDLPSNLSGVMVKAHALSPQKGYVVVYYEFDNVQGCMKEAELVDQASL